ncbi:hypothetical protein [Chryseobacterium gambrini]|uniref:hypothetical protein n=1 Tax=Chryseobacterium gambrini TaxID=373672 RepID=UPI0022F17A2D|nr:hypothetical protein [Chryseobacterium gambrini]WBV51292.1 hypothetical protein PFY09_13235 [Chryseobacterium gambrini]
MNHKSLSDTIIVVNKIDSSMIQEKLNVNKEKIVNLFFNCFSKDDHPSYVVFDQVKNNHHLIDIKKYKDLEISGINYPTYLISFSYENDVLYQSLLLTNIKNTDGLVLFEKVINEGEYLRISKINKDKITNVQYKIEYYEYDNDGNIIKEKGKRDSLAILSNVFEVNNEMILNSLFKNLNATKSISKKWLGIYKARFNYGKIGGVNAGWDLEINVNKATITASGNGYQIGFMDELNAVEKDNKLVLNYKKNIDGLSLGENMNPEFIITEENGKYYIQSEWIDVDVLTKPKKNGYEIYKK